MVNSLNVAPLDNCALHQALYAVGMVTVVHKVLQVRRLAIIHLNYHRMERMDIQHNAVLFSPAVQDINAAGLDTVALKWDKCVTYKGNCHTVLVDLINNVIQLVCNATSKWD